MSLRAKQMLGLLFGLAVASVVLIAVQAPGENTPGQSAGTTPPLRIAMSGVYPPFNYFDENNTLAGFDVEMARELARRLGREPELVTTAWDGILAGLIAGKFDLIIGSMAITEARKKSVSFSDPYYVSGAQLIVREDSAITHQEALAGKVVGVTLGTTYEEHVRQIPGVRRVATYKGGAPDLLLELSNKRIDAMVTDRLVGIHAIKQSRRPMKLTGELLYREEMGIAARKDDTELLARVNEALAAMKTDGAYSEISRKVFGTDILQIGGDA